MRNFFRKWLGAPVSPEPSPRAATTPDAAPFVPQNALEEALVGAATDPGLREEFQRVLLAGDLYAATPEAPEPGARDLEAGEMLALLNVAGPDGAPVAALFSSEGRIVEAFGAGTGFLRIPAARLLEMVSTTGAILNPGSAYGVRWNKEELAALLGKPVRWCVEEPTTVMLGAPSEPPEALLAMLRQSLDRDPRISEAWFALAYWPSRNEHSWYLDVRTDLDADAVNAMLSDGFRMAALGGQSLNMVVHPPGGEEGVGIRLVPATTH